MSSIGEVLRFGRSTVNGDEVDEVVVDPGGGANVTADQAGPAGDDSPPLPGDLAALIEAPGSGNVQAVGYRDVANAGEAEPGEKRLYSRDGDGVPIAVVWLKADGTIELRNDNGSIELSPGGDVSISGSLSVDGSISTGGNVTADGQVTGGAASTPIGLTTHIHGTPSGNSGPPQPAP